MLGHMEAIAGMLKETQAQGVRATEVMLQCSQAAHRVVETAAATASDARVERAAALREALEGTRLALQQTSDQKHAEFQRTLAVARTELVAAATNATTAAIATMPPAPSPAPVGDDLARARAEAALETADESMKLVGEMREVMMANDRALQTQLIEMSDRLSASIDELSETTRLESKAHTEELQAAVEMLRSDVRSALQRDANEIVAVREELVAMHREQRDMQEQMRMYIERNREGIEALVQAMRSPYAFGASADGKGATKGVPTLAIEGEAPKIPAPAAAAAPGTTPSGLCRHSIFEEAAEPAADGEEAKGDKPAGARVRRGRV